MYDRIKKNRTLLNRVSRDLESLLEELDPEGTSRHPYPSIIEDIQTGLLTVMNRIYSLQCLMAVDWHEPMPKLYLEAAKKSAASQVEVKL